KNNQKWYIYYNMAKLIIGLGNPGDTYKNNRHNVGFKVIDSLAKKLNIALTQEQFKGIYGVGLLDGEKIVLAKPLTFMNLSGEFVSQFMRYYNVSNEDIIVIYDDVDTNLGEIRCRTSGSSGGQNGVKDIIAKLNTEDFKRIKIGIGPKNKQIPLANYVLGNFSKTDIEKLASVINLVGKMINNINQTEFSNLLDYTRKNT
ncbi:MAG: aminoacyl-tRNA hydrolase, partial [Mycoplasma sp.]